MMNNRKAYKPKQRNSQKRTPKRILLIKAEGKNKTEINYFNNFESDTIHVVRGKGNETDPKNMMQQLINQCDSDGLDENDLAVCLVDADFNPSKNAQLSAADQLISKRKNIKLIVSNPCFEIWFICHFVYTTRNYTSSDDVLRFLKRSIPDYEKNSLTVFSSLKENGNVDDAIKNAKRLEQYCLNNRRQPHTVNFTPSTEVYKIFTEFLLKSS